MINLNEIRIKSNHSIDINSPDGMATTLLCLYFDEVWYTSCLLRLTEQGKITYMEKTKIMIRSLKSNSRNLLNSLTFG
jgi:hypothetical protein